MLQRIKGVYLRKSCIEKCRHPKTTTLSMIAIVSSSFFLYVQLARNGDPLLGVIAVLSFLVFFLLVEPHVNALLPIKRVRIFDKNPPVLFLFASAILFLISALVVLGEFIPVEGGHMILKDYSSLFTVVTYSVELLIIGLIFLLTWPYAREMDLTIDIARVQR